MTISVTRAASNIMHVVENKGLSGLLEVRATVSGTASGMLLYLLYFVVGRTVGNGAECIPMNAHSVVNHYGLNGQNRASIDRIS